MVPIGSPLEASYRKATHRRYVCDVPTSQLQFHSLMAAWVGTLRTYRDRGTNAARHELANWFASTAPTTVADVLGLAPSAPWLDGNPLEATFPWIDRSPQGALADRRHVMDKEARENGLDAWNLADGWRSFGPVSDRLVDLELTRLACTHDSIANNGFDRATGTILGRVRVSGDALMVLPVGGWHRTAALLALGASTIPMQFSPTVPVVRRHEVAWWPNVANGLFTVDQALAVFDHQFVYLADGATQSQTIHTY